MDLEKKTIEAAKEYNKKVENELKKVLHRKQTSGELFANSVIRECSFQAGAPSEEPRNKATVLVISEDNDNMIYCLESDYQDWNHEVELWDIDKWCYLEVLLPKQKGGEKMNMNELHVGDIFIIPKGDNGKEYYTIEVQEVTEYNTMHNRCTGCIFYGAICCQNVNHVYGRYASYERSDGKNVIFVEKGK